MPELFPDTPTLLLLLAAAFLAGLFDAAVGGGGLIQVPALFTLLPGAPPALLLGTNKLASFFGTVSAVLRYRRALRLEWSFLRYTAPLALAGAFAGASVVTYLPASWVKPLVLMLLVLMLLRTWLDRQSGLKPQQSTLPTVPLAVVSSLAIGFYDGFFGPGTGSILIFVLVHWLAQDYLHASAHAKVINASTNLGALIYFAAHGHVLWALGLVMAAANIGGSQIGARLALKGGAVFIRKLFLLLCFALIVRLSMDIWR